MNFIFSNFSIGPWGPVNRSKKNTARNFEFVRKNLCTGIFPGSGDFEFERKNPCTGIFPCTGDFEFERKNPCTGISPCTGDVEFERKKSQYWDYHLYWRLHFSSCPVPLEKRCSTFFFRDL